jgi:polysaccharide biosynthesis protein PslJ
VTVILLYVGNLTEQEMPQRRVVRMLGVLFLTTVAGGLLGVILPKFGFVSPLEYLLPRAMRSDPYIQALVHPSSSQVQAVLGYSSGRPSAPWGYTNTWGNNYSILLLWFVIGWWVGRSWSRRAACLAVIAASLAPVIYSLNRALWVGLILTICYLGLRLMLRGRVWAVGAMAVVAAAGAVVFLVSPLHTIVLERLAHPHSNNLRGLLSTEAVRGATESPILGWGGTRKIVGSDKSITIGKTKNCPLCGNFAIGSNGQLWMVMFNQGFVGASFFFGFFAFCVWFYSRDGTPIGQAGVFAVALTFLYMFFYSSLPSSLALVMISVALLWRSSEARHDGLRVAAPPRHEALVGAAR